MNKLLSGAVLIAMVATACQTDADPSSSDRAADTTTSIADTIGSGSGSGSGSDSGDGRGDDGRAASTGTEAVLASMLRTYDECDALLGYLRSAGAERVGPYGFGRGGWYGWEGDAATADEVDDAGMEAQDAAPTAEAALESGVDFSGTNVQELGVDEADIIKTDGRRILVVSGDELVVVDAASREEQGRLTLSPAWQREMFLVDDDVLVLSVGEGWAVPFEETVDADAEESFIVPWGGSPTTTIEHVSLSDTPTITETIHFDGHYVSARAVDGTARIVLRSDPQDRMPFVVPQNRNGEERAAEANRALIDATTLDDWLPSYTRTTSDGVETEGFVVDCDAVHVPGEFAGFGVLSVVSLPLGGGFAAADTASVLAPGDTVYASPTSLFVATTTWTEPELLADERAWEEWSADARTSVHRFDISEPAAVYRSSGSVPGFIRDQFSLSEWNDSLRVVTTTAGDPWREESESWVRVLQERDGELIEVGSVGDLGNGEQVQSVRFAGDVGYVVTFRQIDPFYTVDLSDPTDPRVLGELKIPGFSSYLHPIGDGLVLGVGSDADIETGRVLGSKVSLFDVSDVANPREVAVWNAPDSWNEIGWEHRSFLWWEPERLAVIPVTVWSDNYAGAVVLRIGDDSITEVGRLDHVDEGAEPGVSGCEPLTAADLGLDADAIERGEFDSELAYVLTYEDGHVLVCSQGEEPSTVGYDCFSEPWVSDEGRRLGLDLAEGDELFMCFPNEQPATIARTLVIGDELWSLSQRWVGDGPEARLQANELTSLERLAVLNL